MYKSDSIVEISKALVKAQRKIGAATKGSANPFFRSKYADLGSVMEACKEHLNNEGIAVLQPPAGMVEGKHVVETILLHESGEFISSAMVLELTKTNMQDLGSAISYARRYSLQSLVFIPAEDDDGEKTMVRDAKPSNTSTPQEVTPAKKAPGRPPKAKEGPQVSQPVLTPPPVSNGKSVQVEEEW